MLLLVMAAFAAPGTAEDDPIGRYIDCIKAEVARMSGSDVTDEGIANSAVVNCEEFATASAQALVEETPPELLAAYADMGVTPEMYLERQKQIGRDAGRAMALDMLAESNAEDSTS